MHISWNAVLYINAGFTEMRPMVIEDLDLTAEVRRASEQLITVCTISFYFLYNYIIIMRVKPKICNMLCSQIFSYLLIMYS